jgi:glycosyltransferase involved in cell wall biosynthesis
MKLSVFVLTRNHERFIEQALRGVLAQRTTFDFELVVGEDASTDGTAAIVRRLQAEHPDKIRATLRTHNVGMHRNFEESYRACRGEYVAFLDGDDYWTAPDKLQKQVDFLDAHPGYTLCFHNARVWFEGRGETGELLFDNPDGRTTFEIDDLILANLVPGCSILARNGLIDRFPNWLPEVPLVDWVFNLMHARHGSVGYFPEPMAVYRRHGGGLWSSQEGTRRNYEAVLKVYEKMPGILDRRHWALARAAAERFHLFTANEWLRGQVADSRAEVGQLSRTVEWLQGQVANYEAEVERLNRAMDWLRGQLAGCEAQLKESVAAYNAGQAWIAELDGIREGLARRLEEQRRAHTEEVARLHKSLSRIESSRGWRAVLLTRRLVNSLWKRPARKARRLAAALAGGPAVPGGGAR